MSEIEVVRGRLGTATREALLAHGTAPERVVCVVRDASGTLAGACAVHEVPFPGASDRRLWRLELLGAAIDRFREVHAATWRALDADYAPPGPEGLIGFPSTPHAELEWPEPRTILAGYGADGREARVAYFSAARTTPVRGWPPEDPPYRIRRFAEQEAVSADDVTALWRREDVLDEAEARRRADETLLVATDLQGELVGVATSYLRRNEQVRLDLHYVRAYVSAAHRRGTAATALAVGAREELEAAFTSGRDTRAPGMCFEVENPLLKQVYPEAVWNEVGVSFIGSNERGDHVRVYYFAGARTA